MCHNGNFSLGHEGIGVLLGPGGYQRGCARRRRPLNGWRAAPWWGVAWFSESAVRRARWRGCLWAAGRVALARQRNLIASVASSDRRRAPHGGGRRRSTWLCPAAGAAERGAGCPCGGGLAGLNSAISWCGRLWAAVPVAPARRGNPLASVVSPDELRAPPGSSRLWRWPS